MLLPEKQRAMIKSSSGSAKSISARGGDQQRERRKVTNDRGGRFISMREEETTNLPIGLSAGKAVFGRPFIGFNDYLWLKSLTKVE